MREGRGVAIPLMPCDISRPLWKDDSGDQGELWIAGPQVGLGYMRQIGRSRAASPCLTDSGRRPELTLERFYEIHELGRCFRSAVAQPFRDAQQDATCTVRWQGGDLAAARGNCSMS